MAQFPSSLFSASRTSSSNFPPHNSVITLIHVLTNRKAAFLSESRKKECVTDSKAAPTSTNDEVTSFKSLWQSLSWFSVLAAVTESVANPQATTMRWTTSRSAWRAGGDSEIANHHWSHTCRQQVWGHRNYSYMLWKSWKIPTLYLNQTLSIMRRSHKEANIFSHIRIAWKSLSIYGTHLTVDIHLIIVSHLVIIILVTLVYKRLHLWARENKKAHVPSN